MILISKHFLKFVIQKKIDHFRKVENSNILLKEIFINHKKKHSNILLLLRNLEPKLTERESTMDRKHKL